MRRSSGRRNTRPRRKLVWARSRFNQTFTVPAFAGDNFGVPVQVDLLDPFRIQLGASPIGCTIVRTRGILAVQKPSAVAAVSLLLTAHVTDTDDATRAMTDADNAFSARAFGNDYYLYEPFVTVRLDAGGTTPDPSWGTNVCARLIDVKSSRKVEELNQTVVMRLHGNSSVAATVAVSGTFSHLIALA